jgi:hypothetical protein
MTERLLSFPGVNIQFPWSRLIADGKKTIETRHYSLPEKYLGVPLAIIETPGQASFKSRIIGLVTFDSCFLYANKQQWKNDRDRHLVGENDKLFKYRSTKPKWAWTVKKVVLLTDFVPPPSRRGIVFASKCVVPAHCLTKGSKIT